MALEDLIARLESDTLAKVDAIQREAEAAVRALETQNAEAQEQKLSRQRQAARVVRHREQERALAEVRRTQRLEVLEARRALVERLFTRAREALEEVGDSEGYRAALPRHLDEALAYLEALQPVAYCRPADAPPLEAHLRGRGDVTLVPDEALGPGVVARAADGSVEVDNTLAARLERLRPALAVELLAEAEAARPERAVELPAGLEADHASPGGAR